MSLRLGCRLLPRLLLFTLLLLAAPPAQAEIPQQGWVIWQSTRQDGRLEIYLGNVDGSTPTRLTHEGGMYPLWSPDGRWISFSDEVGSVARLMRRDGSEKKEIFSGKPHFWLHDNSGLVCEADDNFYLVDPDTGDSRLLFQRSHFPQFTGHSFLVWPGSTAITHDNRYLVTGTDLYRYGYTGENGSFTAGFAAAIVDLQQPDRTFFFGSGCGPVTPPSGSLVYHVCGECPTSPDIYRMDLADLHTRSSYAPEKADEDPNWGHEYTPRISKDGQWVVYQASNGCHASFTCDYEIFIHRLGASVTERTRVTQEPTFDGHPDLYVGELWVPGSEPKHADAATGGDGSVHVDAVQWPEDNFGVSESGCAISAAPEVKGGGGMLLLLLAWGGIRRRWR